MTAPNYNIFASALMWKIGQKTNPITNYILDGYAFYAWSFCPICGVDHSIEYGE